MNDFLRELEAELTTASRRRSARRARPWWRRPPVPSPRPAVVAAAGVALLAILLGIAVAALRGGGDDDRTAQPEPSATMPLTALVPLTSCSNPTETLTGGDVKGLTASLAVFRRAQREPDGLSVPSGFDGSTPGSWLPVARWAGDAVRRPGEGVVQTPIQLALGFGAPGATTCAQRRSGGEPVVCVLADAIRRPGARCFTSADLRRGRALTIIDSSGPTVAGVVPDGVQQVTLRWGGRTATAPVAENAFQARLPGAAAGTPVGVTVGDSSCQTGPTPRRLLETVPALTLDSQGRVLPTPVVQELTRGRGVAAARARLVTSRQHVGFWVVPAGMNRCSDGRVAGSVDRACALAASAEQLLGVSCAGTDQVRRGALTFADRGGGDVVVVGLAPPGTDAAIVPTPRGYTTVPVIEGVLGGFLPPGVTPAQMRGVKVNYRPARKPAADRQTVVVLDASGTEGSDQAVAERLASLARGTASEGEVLHGVATLPTRATSSVEYARTGRAKARRVAALLGIRDVGPLQNGVPTAGARVVVIVGRDARIPFSAGSPG